METLSTFLWRMVVFNVSLPVRLIDYGLRDYGIPGQLGLERTPQEYVDKLVAVFREVRRVLRSDGVCWLNLGDSYATNRNDHEGGGFAETWRERRVGKSRPGTAPKKGWHGGPDLKPKDLCMIPARVALALQADGWWLRSECVWHKPNPMPESVTDRPTKAHEMIYLLAKSATYFYDAEAIKEPAVIGWNGSSFTDERDKLTKPNLGMKPRGGGFSRKYAEQQPDHGAMNLDRPQDNGFRNRRSVWTVATQPYSGAHFATFPPALVEPMILAGTSPQACEHCGAAWERVTERGESSGVDGKSDNSSITLRNDALRHSGRIGETEVFTLGWQPTCACPNNTGSGRCLVIDPFAGTATVGRECAKHNRHFVGVELNLAYIDLAYQRTSGIQKVLLDV